ncbi:MAG: DUF6850 family outer membrane beta-barrel protein [Acidobacteriota bacterium]
MKKSLLLIAATFSVLVSVSKAQNVRMNSLGGIKYAVSDQDNSLNLYDFGKNPAWLINDEKEVWLKITPSYDRQWGDYRRPYDFKASNGGGMSFTGLKPLGNSGTFLGMASYSYEEKRDIYRSIKRNPYDGTAFLPTDSTTGNFRYDGPSVGFAYSFEILPGLFLGAQANYQLLDGLKNIYSMAKTIYRNVGGKLGVAYAFSDNFVFGLDYQTFDSQESLEMKNVIAQTEVEIFNFRGDTYATSIRKSTVEEKFRNNGNAFGAQLYFRPLINLETAIKGDYTVSAARAVMPRGQSIKEFEEGYSSLENYNLEFNARYQVSGNLSLGAALEYSKDDSWSKNSELNLLIWQWNLKRTSAGLGAAYSVQPLDLLVGIDYEIDLLNADSSKYIDSKFLSLSSTNSMVRIGAEKRVYDDLYIRAGYNYGKDQVDLITGGKNVVLNNASLGLGFRLFEATKVDFIVQYGNMSPSGYADLSRNHFSAAATVRLNSF